MADSTKSLHPIIAAALDPFLTPLVRRLPQARANRIVNRAPCVHCGARDARTEDWGLFCKPCHDENEQALGAVLGNE